MNIRTMILGFLDWKPMSGYELKKIFSALAFLPWSGNNNQIYTALVALQKEGLVRVETDEGARGPVRKVYSLLPAGRDRLCAGISEPAAEPDGAHEFLMQLAFADCLTPEALRGLLDAYGERVSVALRAAEETARRRAVHPARTDREDYLWDMIEGHRIEQLRVELNWLTRLRNGLNGLHGR